MPDLREALDHVQDALERADRSRLRGRAWSLTARLPRDSSCPRVARGLLEEYAREELGEREREDAMVITSELATNAFLHGDGAIVLNIDAMAIACGSRCSTRAIPEHIGVVPRTNGTREPSRAMDHRAARERLGGRRWDRARVGGAVCRPALRRPHTGTTGGGGFG